MNIRQRQQIIAGLEILLIAVATVILSIQFS